MKRITLAIFLASVSDQMFAQDEYWATTDRVYRRTCASESCGEVGYAMFRNKIVVLEEVNGWARVTDRYDGFCTNGVSQYVDSGNNRCTAENGFTNGEFSEWVQMSALSKTRPADPAADASGIELLIAGSDDYRNYKDQFVKAAQELLESRRCTEADIKEMGGFWKSTSFGNRPVYFMYCGGMTPSNRIYLDTSTGEIFK